MKTKSSNKKLLLNKEMIASLEDVELKIIRGGAERTDYVGACTTLDTVARDCTR